MPQAMKHTDTTQQQTSSTTVRS